MSSTFFCGAGIVGVTVSVFCFFVAGAALLFVATVAPSFLSVLINVTVVHTPKPSKIAAAAIRRQGKPITLPPSFLYNDFLLANTMAVSGSSLVFCNNANSLPALLSAFNNFSTVILSAAFNSSSI